VKCADEGLPFSYVAACCSVLQYVVFHLKCHDFFRVKYADEILPFLYVAGCCSVMQRVALRLKCHDLLCAKCAPFPGVTVSFVGQEGATTRGSVCESDIVCVCVMV